MLAHKDREWAKQNWAAFQKDPDWQAAFKESQKNGPLQTQVQSCSYWIRSTSRS